jgi:hypothetical protein
LFVGGKFFTLQNKISPISKSQRISVGESGDTGLVNIGTNRQYSESFRNKMLRLKSLRNNNSNGEYKFDDDNPSVNLVHELSFQDQKYNPYIEKKKKY